MSSLDLIFMSLRNLTRRKMRTIFTLMGVLIGAASIITMVSLIMGMQATIEERVSRMGSLTTLNVYNYSNDPNVRERAELDDKFISMVEGWKGVEAVSPVVYANVKGVSGKYLSWLNLIGMKPEAMVALGYEATEGRMLTADDTSAVVMGAWAQGWWYNPKRVSYYYYDQGGVDMWNDKVEITFDVMYGEDQKQDGGSGQSNKPAKLHRINVVGTIRESGDERDWYIVMNADYLRQLIKEYQSTQGGFPGQQQQQKNPTYDRVIVKVRSLDSVKEIQKRIQDLGLTAYGLIDTLEEMQATTSGIKLILGFLGFICLIVACFGICNTMIMSIYERTREIGIMKVLGATFADIRKQFLFEAAAIGFIGGLVGLAISAAISFFLNTFGADLFGDMIGGGYYYYYGDSVSNAVSLIPAWLAVGSLVLTTFVGVLAGIYPALRAMRLSALEAIRNE
ncbi:MAG: ABC transporter permease [Oscillospiraceae bacterium]|nr:ABC transporter permease [Oscillospiraceae bacterium]